MILISEQQAAEVEGISVEEFRQRNSGQERRAVAPGIETVVYSPVDGGMSDDHLVIDPSRRATFLPCPCCHQAVAKIVKRGRQAPQRRVRTFGELFNALEKRIEAHGCTPDLLHVRAICNENGLDADQVVPFLENHGGGCDCEVLLNAGTRVDHDKRLPVLA